MGGIYLGESKHTLENNCRLIVPLRFRSSLQPEFILFKAPEGCLFIYDTENFKEVSDQLTELYGSEEGRRQAREVMSRLRFLTLDKQGRFTIPADYIEHAGLGGSVYLLGMGNKIEVWDEKAYLSKGKAAFPSIRL